MKSVCIHKSWMTTHWRKIKTGFALFDKILHQTSLAVKFDEIFRWCIHVSDNKCVQICQLIFWFFNFTNNTSFIRPWACLIHEFAINHSIINLVFLSDFIELIYQIRCLFAKIVVFLKSDNIASAIFFALFVKVWCSKTAIATKQELDWLIIF